LLAGFFFLVEMAAVPPGCFGVTVCGAGLLPAVVCVADFVVLLLEVDPVEPLCVGVFAFVGTLAFVGVLPVVGAVAFVGPLAFVGAVDFVGVLDLVPALGTLPVFVCGVVFAGLTVTVGAEPGAVLTVPGFVAAGCFLSSAGGLVVCETAALTMLVTSARM